MSEDKGMCERIEAIRKQLYPERYEYPLTLGEALKLAVDEDVKIEIDGCNRCFWFNRSKSQVVWHDNGEHLNLVEMTKSRFRIKREPPKMVTWYLPKTYWDKNGTTPTRYRGDPRFRRSKIHLENWFGIPNNIKVLTWYEELLPETFDQVEVGDSDT